MDALELLGEIAKYAANPAITITAIILWDRFQAKRNGISAKDIAEDLQPELLHHLDMAITQHFDQLRRDLTTSIEKATENSIMRYLWEVERRRDRA